MREKPFVQTFDRTTEVLDGAAYREVPAQLRCGRDTLVLNPELFSDAGMP